MNVRFPSAIAALFALSWLTAALKSNSSGKRMAMKIMSKISGNETRIKPFCLTLSLFKVKFAAVKLSYFQKLAVVGRN